MAPKNAEYGSSSNDDSDEDLNVELKDNATKVRMTGASRDSDEPAKESADTISAMALKFRIVAPSRKSRPWLA